MAHIIFENDSGGDVVNATYYCSDYCAKADPNYAGWSGAYEIYAEEFCAECGSPLDFHDLFSYFNPSGKDL